MALNRPFFSRSVWMDLGEQLDVSQVVNQGGSILAGQAFNNQLYGSAMAQDNITATPSGTQLNSLLVTGPLIRVTTVATAGDAILLPPSIRGMEIAVANDAAANAMNVFPAVGEKINSLATNAAFSMVVSGASGPTIFFCFSNGVWRTK